MLQNHIKNHKKHNALAKIYFAFNNIYGTPVEFIETGTLSKCKADTSWLEKLRLRMCESYDFVLICKNITLFNKMILQVNVSK